MVEVLTLHMVSIDHVGEGKGLLLVMEMKDQALYAGFSTTTQAEVSRHLIQPEGRSLGSPLSLCFLGGLQFFVFFGFFLRYFTGVEQLFSESFRSWQASPSLLLCLVTAGFS